MNPSNTVRPKITTEHCAKLAYVYLRQSSPGQVLHNTESTVRQYALIERAVALGWPRDRVRIIDDDLGRSGTSTDRRPGFQQLMVEVGLAQVGLVLALEADRLSRNSGDWYRLIELCSIFGTLIADSELVYDPRTYHDRLLLGLAGMMSEAELHHIKMRLDAGKRSKAARGELRFALPVGLERHRSGEVTFHPDEQIQARLRLVFDKFRELGSARAVMRYLVRQGLKLPTRRLKGPGPHEVIWVAPTASNVRNILQNPAYAGAYVYGRKRVDPTRRQPGRRQSGMVRQPIDRWETCLQAVYPAYISWDEFVVNQKKLATNQTDYRKGKTGVARCGRALLQGIVVCRMCGAHMALRYEGRHSQFPVYVCEVEAREYSCPRCQQVRGDVVDAQVERLVLEALAPDRIAIALSALEQLETESAALTRQWELSIERARIEALRAQRQYCVVEPENRLVARNLEHMWETKLRAVEEVEKEFLVWRTQHQAVITAEDRQQILALGEDLPKLWSSPGTTHADRKQIIRLVIREVILDQKCERGKVWFQINWQTGATTEHVVKRRTDSYEEHADRDQLRQRVLELNAEGKTDAEIAGMLKGEGYRTTRQEEINPLSVWHMRKLWGIRATRGYDNGHNPLRWDDGTYSIQGVMAMTGRHKSTVHYWLRQGLLQGRQLAKWGPWKIFLDDEQIEVLRGKSVGEWAATPKLPPVKRG